MSPNELLTSEVTKPNTKVSKKQIRQQLLADFLDLTERVIENLFQCGKTDEVVGKAQQLPPLADFGWMIIHRCQLTFSNIVLALLYLIRLKQRHPSCKGAYGSGHRLFLAALIVGNKYLYDDAYHNHTWSEVSQGAFQKEEVNRMEFELIYFLNFSLNVTESQWSDLVDLLDNKLHNELVNVGCKDSRRYRLSEECGFIMKNNLRELNIGSEVEDSEEEGETNAVLFKERMNQDPPSRLVSPLQEHNTKNRYNKPTPPTPTKMLHLPLHQNSLNPTDPTTLSNGYVRRRRGSQLKFQVTSPSKLMEPSSVPNSAFAPTFNMTRRNSSVSNFTPGCLSDSWDGHDSLSGSSISSAKSTSKPLPRPPGLLDNSPDVTRPHPLLHSSNVSLAHVTAAINYPRRKSLPAMPVTTNTTSQVNFYLNPL